MPPPSAVVMDIREAYHLRDGVAPGTINVPLGLLFAHPELAPQNVELLVVGHGEGDAKLAVRFLRELGFVDARVGTRTRGD